MDQDQPLLCLMVFVSNQQLLIRLGETSMFLKHDATPTFLF